MGKELETLGDDELALALKAGQRSAFDELVRRHQGRVYAVAYRFTANREDALDVAQEAFLKVYRKIGMWEPRGGFVPWLMRLTTNQAIDHMRRARRHRSEPLPDEQVSRGDSRIQTRAMDTEREARAHEIDAHVQRALEALSPMQRAVFVLRHYEGMQLAEIATARGCSVGSVKVHLFRAVNKLRDELGDLGRFC